MIFADPGDERAATLAHLDWLEGEITRRTNGQMRCLRTSCGRRLSDNVRARFVSAPFFTINRRGKIGQGKRQCTREFKIEPLERMQRALLGYRPRQRIPKASCEVWIGISTDEVVRAGAAYTRWAVNRYPLLEMRMSRHDCVSWLTSRGYSVPPKSACVFCPYKTDAEWRLLRDEDPQAWADVVEIDRLIRTTPSMRQAEFLHRSCKPLDEVDLSTAEERGQGMLEVCDAGCGL